MCFDTLVFPHCGVIVVLLDKLYYLVVSEHLFVLIVVDRAAELLVLPVGLALPLVNDQCAEVMQCLFTNLGLGSVTDEFGWCAVASYVLLECAEEFTVGFASSHMHHRPVSGCQRRIGLL
jgi:Na+-transporting methylmalonyl-CoA/oxaloacetate decarboxylase beta subunit